MLAYSPSAPLLPLCSLALCFPSSCLFALCSLPACYLLAHSVLRARSFLPCSPSPALTLFSAHSLLPRSLSSPALTLFSHVLSSAHALFSRAPLLAWSLPHSLDRSLACLFSNHSLSDRVHCIFSALIFRQLFLKKKRYLAEIRSCMNNWLTCALPLSRSALTRIMQKASNNYFASSRHLVKTLTQVQFPGFLCLFFFSLGVFSKGFPKKMHRLCVNIHLCVLFELNLFVCFLLLLFLFLFCFCFVFVSSVLLLYCLLECAT